MSLFSDEKIEEQALVVSSFVRKENDFDFQHPLTAKSPLLESLGIEFKYIKGKSFWEANLDRLEYIYDDFCKRSRSVLVELHPDKGGDGHEFGKFAKLIAQVKKLFWKKGIGKDMTFFRALEKQEYAEKQKEIPNELKKNFVRPKRAFKPKVVLKDESKIKFKATKGIFSASHRQALSNALKGRKHTWGNKIRDARLREPLGNPNRQIPKNKEWCDKISQSLMGKFTQAQRDAVLTRKPLPPWTVERRAAFSKSLKGKKKSIEHRIKLMKPRPEGFRKKMSEIRKGKPLSMAHREALRKAHTGQKRDSECKKAISEGLKQSWVRRKAIKENENRNFSNRI
jgi:hypothetical protein